MRSNTPYRGIIWLTALLACLLCLPFVRAQETGGLDESALGESAEAVRELKTIPDKTLIFVFDISGSMRGQLLRRARTATINLIREGTAPGDRVVLYTFGAAYEKVFDEKLANEAAKRDLIEQIPNKPGDGAGTNIRRPHHEALKILEAELPKSGAVVLLTDSFNDEPKKDDPAYSDYLRYYLPGGRLTKYPDTPENRDYERLLQKMTSSQTVKMFGIGVQIDQSGRPVERLPKAAPTPAPDNLTGGKVDTQPVIETKPQKDGNSNLPLIAGLLAAAVAIIGGLLFLPGLSKPMPIRVTGGPGGKKEFQLKSGQSINLGGEGAAAYAFDAYPLPGVATAPVSVRGGRGGQFTLVPASVQTPGVPAPKVFHNGMPLEKEATLNYGDEVRISIVDASGMTTKEYRLKFDDPSKSF